MPVLLVEDDASLGEAVRDHIAAEAHAVDWVRRLDDAEAVALISAVFPQPQDPSD